MVTGQWEAATQHSTLDLRTLLIAIAVVAGVAVAWLLSDILFIIFAAVIIATLLTAAADLVARVVPLPHPWPLLISSLLLAGLFLGAVVLFGMQAASEVTSLVRRLPALLDDAGERLGIADLGPALNDLAANHISYGGVFGSLAAYTTNAVAVIGSLIIVFFGAIYLAVDRRTYTNGASLLVPVRHRDRFRSTLAHLGRVLRLWLLGQLAAMVVVGVATTAGLYLLGVESALALGLLAGLLEFIPFLGPILAFLVAIIFALSQDLTLALWVTILYLVIQQLESNILVPLIQQRMVALPPALGLFALLALGALFGPSGVLFGVPLTVLLLAAVKRLYVVPDGPADASAAPAADEKGTSH